jgi:hypothetical protein
MRIIICLMCLTAFMGRELDARPIDDVQRPRKVDASVMKNIHGGSMAAFLTYRKMRYGKPALDWDTDFCSGAPDTALHFDFTNACIRHDFGYRNYKKFKIFTKAARKRIDDRFLADMRAHCATRHIFIRGSCRQTALLYYAAVRRFGK